MIKFIIIAVAIYLLVKLLKPGASGKEARAGLNRNQKSPGGEDLVEDPVCHTYIPISSALKLEVEGKTLYFCSQKCKDTYVLGNKK